MPLDPSTPRFPSALHRCLRGFRPKSGTWLGLTLLACALVTTSCIRVKHRSGARTSTARVPIAEGTLNVFGLELTGEPGTPHEGFALSIPPGAVASDFEIEVQVFATFGDPRLPSIVPKFEIEPQSLLLGTHGRLTLDYSELYDSVANDLLDAAALQVFSLGTAGDPDSVHLATAVDTASRQVTARINGFGSYYALHPELFSLLRQQPRFVDPSVPTPALNINGRLIPLANGETQAAVGAGSLESFWGSGSEDNLIVLHGLAMSPLDVRGSFGLLPPGASIGLGADFANVIAYQYPTGRAIAELGNDLYERVMRNRGPGFGTKAIAHSTGGLVLRYALEQAHRDPGRSSYAEGDLPLSHFITDAVFLATPHRGSDAIIPTFGSLLATLEPGGRSDLPGVQDLIPGQDSLTAALNLDWQPPGTRYYALAGDSSGFGGDGLVSTLSARGIPISERTVPAFTYSGPVYDHLTLATFALDNGVIQQCRAWLKPDAHPSFTPMVGEVETPIELQDGIVRIRYTLADHESDTCFVFPRYRLSGTLSNWESATSAAPISGEVAAPAPGREMVFEWDTLADGVGTQGPQIVFVRLDCRDGSGFGRHGESGAFVVFNPR